LEAAGGADIWSADRTAHLLGTCRMGRDPSASVVNADCRAHDVPNLFICDGSVFPTSTAVNPSLTIEALAARTADRICEIRRRARASMVNEGLTRSEEHTSELQSQSNLVCRLLLEKKKQT